LESGDVRRALLEYDTGLAFSKQFGTNRYGLTWVYVAGRTPEFDGPMKRSHTWGSVFLTMARPLLSGPSQ